jgi:hypothetical protein
MKDIRRMQTLLEYSGFDNLRVFSLQVVKGVIGGVKAAFIGYDGERIREDFALLISGIDGFVIGLIAL